MSVSESSPAGVVEVVLPHVGRWWFGEIVTGLSDVVGAAGHRLVVHPLPDGPSRLRFFEAVPWRHDVVAVVVVAVPLTSREIAALRALRVPTGSLGVRAPGLTSVGIDDRGAARRLTEHLLDLGHARIALVGGDPHEPFGFTAAGDRRKGHQFALHARGLWADPALDVPGSWTARGAALATERLLALPEPPTAIFAISDEMAFGVLRALQRRGLAVPGDISVAGFDDHPDALIYGLTTVAQPTQETGARLAAMLLGRRGPHAPEHVTLDSTRLVVRETTGPPPA